MQKIILISVLVSLFIYAEENPFGLDENFQKIDKAQTLLLSSFENITKHPVTIQKHEVKALKQEREKRLRIERAEALQIQKHAKEKREKLRKQKRIQRITLQKKVRQKREEQLTAKQKKEKRIEQVYLDAVKAVE